MSAPATRRSIWGWLLPLAWAVATIGLTVGSDAPCVLAPLVPGGTVGSECHTGLSPADRLDGWLVPPAGSFSDPVFWAQAVFNVLWFVPVGLWVAKRARSGWAALAAGAALGSVIELVQWLAASTRYPSLLDVALNALGAWLGGVCATRFPSRVGSAGSAP